MIPISPLPVLRQRPWGNEINKPILELAAQAQTADEVAIAAADAAEAKFTEFSVDLEDSVVAANVTSGPLTTAALNGTFGSWVSVKSFGAVGDGVTDDTDAFNDAIDYANSLNPGMVDAANVVGVTLFVPVGRYKLLGQVTAFRKSGINLRGAGPDGSVLLLSYNGDAFRFGDGTSDLLVGGGVSDLKIEYLAAPGASATVFGVQHASRIIWSNLLLVNVGTFIDAGPSAARFASSLWVQNVRGYMNNCGRPFLRVRHGAGLFGSGVSMFVGGVTAPAPDRVSTMTTAPGTDAIRAGDGSWDTIQFTGSFFERFDRGLMVAAGAGVIVNNIFMANCYFDYTRHQAIHLNATSAVSGGVFGVRLSNNWYASWEEAAIQTFGPGAMRGITVSGGQIASAGSHGVNIGGGSRDVRVDGIDIQGVNRTNVNASGVLLIAGSHVSITNVTAGHDAAWSGFAWQAYAGVYVIADLDHFTITGNDLAGTSAGLVAEANAAGSVNRIIRSNRGVSYAGYVALAAPATDVVVTNTTGMAWDIHIHGGTVTVIQKNGQTITGMTAGYLTIGPGETFRITHSVAPTVSRFVQP